VPERAAAVVHGRDRVRRRRRQRRGAPAGDFNGRRPRRRRRRGKDAEEDDDDAADIPTELSDSDGDGNDDDLFTKIIRSGGTPDKRPRRPWPEHRTSPLPLRVVDVDAIREVESLPAV
jgi:hypothetical protein